MITLTWKRVLVLLALMHLTADAQTLYNLSVGTQIASQGADIASSWGGIEANPRLGRGQVFGARATVIKLAVSGGGLALQYFILRKYPQHRNICTWVNFGMATATTIVAVRNWTLPPKPHAVPLANDYRATPPAVTGASLALGVGVTPRALTPALP